MAFEIPTEGAWPSGRDRAAAVLNESVSALQDRLGVSFQPGVDDLDSFVELPLRLPSGRLALLMRYDGERHGGATVYIDFDDATSPALEELVQSLDLGLDPFEWVSPFWSGANIPSPGAPDPDLRDPSPAVKFADPDAVKSEVLSMATEDMHGLYEIVWSLNVSHPSIDEVSKIVAARDAVLDLVRDSLVRLHRLTWYPSQDHGVVELPYATELLERGSSWRAGHEYVGFIATPQGHDVYFAGGE